MSVQTIFGERLKSLRQVKKLTQIDIAMAMCVNSSWICHLERGRRTPSLTSFIRLCKALDVTPNQMLGWSCP